MLFIITCEDDLKSTIKNNIELFDDLDLFIDRVHDDKYLFACEMGFGDLTKLYIVVTTDINFLQNLKTVCEYDLHLTRYDSDNFVTLYKLNNRRKKEWYTEIFDGSYDVSDYEFVQDIGQVCLACPNCSGTTFVWIESKNKPTFNLQCPGDFKLIYNLRL
jgi:hypothetical protein